MSCNIRFYISAEQRIVPCDISGTILPFSWRHRFFWAVFSMFSLNLQSCKITLWNGALVRKISLLEELAIILFDTYLEICFNRGGAWFELPLIYNGLLLGLLKGLQIQMFKSNVMSKSSPILRLHFISKLNWYFKNNFLRSFLILSLGWSL